MKAILLENGLMWIPIRAESKNGIVGDSMKLISPDDPEYDKWLPFAEKENNNS